MGDKESLPPHSQNALATGRTRHTRHRAPCKMRTRAPRPKLSQNVKMETAERGPNVAPRGLWGLPSPHTGKPHCSLLFSAANWAPRCGSRPPALWGYSESRHVSKAPGQTPWRPSWARPTVDVHVALTAASVFLNGNSSLLQATTTDGRESSRALAEGQITAGGEKMS